MLALSGLGSEAEAGSEIENMIESHVQNFLAESIITDQTKKTNLEEHNNVHIEQKVSSNTTDL